MVPQLIDAGLKVIDLSGDFRLKSREVYEQWYKHEPAQASYVEHAVYGLSEIYGEDVKGATFVSNPGCYATAASLGLIPILAAEWIDPKSIIIDAKSGVSGAGRGLSMGVHYSEMNENFKAYKVNKHQHTPEIEQTLSQQSGKDIKVTFTPHLVPMTRGIMCTMYATLTESVSNDNLIDLYRRFYDGRPFVRIRDEGKLPATKEVWGSNYVDMGFSIDNRTVVLRSSLWIDNLVKGAAGQAIQNLNLMMGWDETVGLLMAPVYP